MTAPAKGPKPGSGRKPGLEEGFSPIDEEGFGGTQGLEPDPIDAAAHENPWATGDPDPLGAPATAAWPAEEHPWTQPPPETTLPTGYPDPLGAPGDTSWTAEEHPWTQPPPENPWATGDPDPLGAP